MILRHYQKKRYDKIDKGKVMVLINRINADNIDDVSILHTWERHLKGMRVPYCVEQHGKNLRLKKEQRVWDKQGDTKP